MKYWNKQGKHQKLYNRLYKKLVPKEGSAKTRAGEILRVASNVYYDVANNGGCNLESSKKRDLNALVDFLDANKFNYGDEIMVKSTFTNYEVLNQAGRIWFGKVLDRMMDFVIAKVDKMRR